MKRDSPCRRELTVDEYFAGVLARDIAVLPRALTLIESRHARHQPLAEELARRLQPYAGGAIRVGITGSPGVGKSTFIEAVGMHLIRQGRRVAVFAVDPSSAISGGSILGDKTRMKQLSAERNAFIRPSPSDGTLGGVARKTRESMLICEAAGFDVVIIETVGVGQSETMVADMTDCFLALMLPGAGDELQGIKRGLLEHVDVIAVNKADGANRRNAELAAQQFARALPAISTKQGQSPAILTCSALHGDGVDAVWQAIESRYSAAKASGELAERRKEQRIRWMWRVVEEGLRLAIRSDPSVAAISGELEQAVRSGQVAPESAASQILATFRWSEDVERSIGSSTSEHDGKSD